MNLGPQATFICVDNSDYNRNEDIYPDRLISLKECLNVLCDHKVSNHERHAGILLMAGERCKVHVALTNSTGILLKCIHGIKMDGTCDILRSLSIAQLALKHRAAKNAQQQIVLLIGSPCTANENELMSIAKQLKKNNISIEIITYGCISKNKEILKKLYEEVNTNNNSKYIEIPVDVVNISSFLLKYFSTSTNNNSYRFYDSNNNSNNNNSNNIIMHGDEDIYRTVQMALEEDRNSSYLNDFNLTGVNENVSNVSATYGNNNTNNTNTSNNVNTNANTNTFSNDMPTVEEIENMQDIDNDLKQALLLSLREYNERQNEANERQNEANETTEQIEPNEEVITEEKKEEKKEEKNEEKKEKEIKKEEGVEEEIKKEEGVEEETQNNDIKNIDTNNINSVKIKTEEEKEKEKEKSTKTKEEKNDLEQNK